MQTEAERPSKEDSAATAVRVLPDHAPTGSRPDFRLDIQGLRGLAVLLVVLYHTNETISGGFIGVDVFFVLSGFVITGLLLREARARDTISLRGFFSRRVRRILPLLAITLTATSLLGVVLLSPLGASETTGKTATAAALINANTFLQRQAQDYFGLPPEANALLHTWSLSVEEQFYLMFPLLVLAGLAVRRRLGRVHVIAAPAAAALIALVSFALYAFMLGNRPDDLVTKLGFSTAQTVGFYSAATRAWEFLAGVVVALLAPRLSRLPRAALSGAGLVGLTLIVGCGLLFTEATGLSPGWMVVPVLGTMLVLSAGLGPRTFPASLLARRAPVWLGDLSYGWYLLHWPLIVFAAANFSITWPRAVAALASLFLAIGAKRAVEDRFRLDNRIRGRRAGALAAVCILVPVLAGGVAVVASRALDIDDLKAANARHIDSARCNRRQGQALAVNAEVCTWAVEKPKGQIVLIGDSHASMWSEAVIGAGNGLGYDVSIATMSGCPTLGGSVVRLRDGAPDVECQQFMEQSVSELRSLEPTLVIMASATYGMLREGAGEDGRWRTADGDWVETVEDRAELVQQGLEDFARPLAEVGIPTVIMHDVPYHSFTTAECSWLRYRVSPRACASVRDRTEVDEELGLSRRLEREASAAGDLTTTIDPVPWLCDEVSCATFGRDTWLYRDGDHISVAASRGLADDFKRLLLNIGL